MRLKTLVLKILVLALLSLATPGRMTIQVVTDLVKRDKKQGE